MSYLDRIHSLNSNLRAYVTVTADKALEAAKIVENEIVQGNYKGAMHGVPVAVKDQIQTEGILNFLAFVRPLAQVLFDKTRLGQA